MYNIYISPKIIKDDNPYIKNLEDSLSSNFRIINKNISRNAVLDLFKYLIRTDIYFLNWIEDLAVRRFGRIQVIAFVLFLFCAKCLRKRIVWTLHNKYSHFKTKSTWVDFMFNLMIKYSDLILTHSQTGINHIKGKNTNYEYKIKYFVHPIKQILPSLSNADLIYEFFIWGDLYPYKGVAEFLKFINEKEGLQKFKILIVGRCQNVQYNQELNKYLSSNIIHYNGFYEIEEIANFANQSKFTLFTYRPDSVLSSGSFMESIRMGSSIIGPNVGAFKDLNSYNFVRTYNTFDEIIDIYNQYLYNKELIRNEVEEFCNENSWDLLVRKFSSV